MFFLVRKIQKMRGWEILQLNPELGLRQEMTNGIMELNSQLHDFSHQAKKERGPLPPQILPQNVLSANFVLG